MENMEKPDMDFTIDHQYGKGHDTMYGYIVQKRWDLQYLIKNDKYGNYSQLQY